MAMSALAFTRLLVPYDGSDPARAALTTAIALAQPGTTVTIVTVVDETTVIAQTASTMLAFDATALIEALDQQGAALLDDAQAQCRSVHVTAAVQLVHATPVVGIVSAIEKQTCDLIVMGTHARTGLARTFLGSTSEGVLRLSPVPVLTVRTGDHIGSAPLASALVAIDDSAPADAAVALAARLQRTAGTQIVACHAVDLTRLYNTAIGYAFEPEHLEGELHDEGSTIVKHALERGGLGPDTPIAIVDGEPALAVIAEAEERHATLIIAGTHGRRGLSRFILGSVAENIVRHSTIPVLVVPTQRSKPAY